AGLKTAERAPARPSAPADEPLAASLSARCAPACGAAAIVASGCAADCACKLSCAAGLIAPVETGVTRHSLSGKRRTPGESVGSIIGSRFLRTLFGKRAVPCS